MHRFSITPPSPAALPVRQRGAVLIIALVMLLLLTLIGVAGMRDTQLQERMSGGARDREYALQAAEAALREAEAAVSGGAFANDQGNNFKNYNVDPNELQRVDAGGNAVTEVQYWRDVYDWTGTNATAYGVALNDVTTPPRYVIEQLPANYSAIPGSTNAGTALASGVPTITDFLITVRGTGTTNETVVILQSQYRHVAVQP
jgi:type IV pilus assembly protein PilX